MSPSNLSVDKRGGTSFEVMWRGALKSNRLTRRRAPIMRLRAALHGKNPTSPGPRRLVAIFRLKLLEWELWLNKVALFKKFVANAKSKTKVTNHER
jgi:hypothetical protein